MRREIIFEPVALRELEEAALWYESQKPNLGDEFQAEVFAMLDRIGETPEQFRHVGLTVRKARLHRFSKYSIYFYIERSRIGVVSVFHASRNPDELKRRLH
jgi:plasmid stabilization system protein ParE